MLFFIKLNSNIYNYTITQSTEITSGNDLANENFVCDFASLVPLHFSSLHFLLERNVVGRLQISEQ